MKDNDNINFLNEIYQIVEMGIVGIDDVIDKISQEEFRNFIIDQRTEFAEIKKECESIYTSYGAKEKNLSKMVKLNSKIVSEVKLMKDDDDKVIAKMMGKGTNTGITKLTDAMNTYNESDKEAYNLAEKLLDTLKNNIEGLKRYL